MYDYQKERPWLFTEEGSVRFTRIRDRVRYIIEQAGAISMGAAIATSTGDTWQMLACVDRLVELGELREITAPNTVAAQQRIFVRGECST